MNDQCLNCRIRKSCYYKEPEEDWTCEHYGYFNGLLGEIDKVEDGGKEVTNEQIGERLNEAEKVIGESLRILNDIKFTMKRDVKKEIAEAYQRGVEDGRNETWEAAKKLSWAEKYGGYGDRLDEVFDRTDTFDFLEYSPNEAIAKLKAYEEKQKAENEIKVRDEVVWTEAENVVIVVTRVYTVDDFEWCDGVCRDGKVYHILTEHARKTGRRFDIDKILEEMKA